MYHTEPPTDITIREWYMNSSRVAACALRNEQAVRAHGQSEIPEGLMNNPVYIFDHISHSSLRMRNVSSGTCKKIKTHFTINNFYFFFENRTFYEIVWKNIVEPDMPQMTLRRMRIGCFKTRATEIRLEYLILFAFPR